MKHLNRYNESNSVDKEPIDVIDDILQFREMFGDKIPKALVAITNRQLDSLEKNYPTLCDNWLIWAIHITGYHHNHICYVRAVNAFHAKIKYAIHKENINPLFNSNATFISDVTKDKLMIDYESKINYLKNPL